MGLIRIGGGMIAAFVCVWIVFQIQNHRAADERREKDLAYYLQTYLSQEVSVPGRENQSLMSFDGGSHWYAVTRSDAGVTVDGPADPALLAQLKCVNELFAYVKQRGAIGLDGQVSQEDEKYLSCLGITVIRHLQQE